MLKRILFAVVPMVLAIGTVSANDSLLTQLAGMSDDAIDVSADADGTDLGKADVDALLGDDKESGDDAVAACFRRIGYGYGNSYSYGHSYSHYNYSYGYGYHCSPVYHHYTYHRPVHVYRPVYTCYTPIYTSYWGCF